MSDTPTKHDLIKKEIEDVLAAVPKPIRLTQQQIEKINEDSKTFSDNNDSKSLYILAHTLLQQYSQHQRETAIIIEHHKKAIELVLSQVN